MLQFYDWLLKRKRFYSWEVIRYRSKRILELYLDDGSLTHLVVQTIDIARKLDPRLAGQGLRSASSSHWWLEEFLEGDEIFKTFSLKLSWDKWYLLMHGAMCDRLCWYPRAHRLHVKPVTPSLQGHCPEVWLHVLPDDPIGWQSHAANKYEQGKSVTSFSSWCLQSFRPVDTDKINKNSNSNSARRRRKRKLRRRRKIIIDENTSSESCKYHFYVKVINDKRC